MLAQDSIAFESRTKSDLDPKPNHTWVQDLTRPRSRIESYLSSDQITLEPRNEFGMCHTPRTKRSIKGTDDMKLEYLLVPERKCYLLINLGDNLKK